MDFIRPIQPDRDVSPLARVQRAQEDRERQRDEREKRDGEPRADQPAPPSPQPADGSPQNEGPVEGDDGHMHIDIRA